MEKKRLKTGREDLPRLYASEGERMAHHRRRKLRRWYAVYLGTAMCVVLLSSVLLLGGLGKRVGVFGEGGGLSQFSEWLGRWIVKNEFMDLSGKTPADPEADKEEIRDLIGVIDGILHPTPDTEVSLPVGGDEEKVDPETLYDFDYEKVPDGEIPILPMDLSVASQGAAYVNNTTGYAPNLSALLAASLREEGSVSASALRGPLVLILHTHATEAYSENGAISYVEQGELARSENGEGGVISVGEVLAQTLNDAGISTLHCKILHDQGQYKDSYARAEQTVRRYLEEYPSIRLVIDLHRDSVIRSSGELVRPVTAVDGKATAQVMCVVGSSWGGDECPNWERNLSLAMKLRESLNGAYGNLCRPTYLRSATYNQELAPYSLLLEMGSSGNSLVEAQRAAVLVGEALSVLIRQM